VFDDGMSRAIAYSARGSRGVGRGGFLHGVLKRNMRISMYNCTSGTARCLRSCRRPDGLRNPKPRSTVSDRLTHLIRCAELWLLTNVKVKQKHAPVDPVPSDTFEGD
jgi:hypothetical protein